MSWTEGEVVAQFSSPNSSIFLGVQVASSARTVSVSVERMRLVAGNASSKSSQLELLPLLLASSAVVKVLVELIVFIEVTDDLRRAWLDLF